VPYHITWAHEHVEPPENGYQRIDSMAELTGIVHELGRHELGRHELGH
jgi:putative hydrolase of the HAD superfamily